MQIDRDWVFDFIETLGNAVANNRQKPATPEWDLDATLEMFLWELQKAKDSALEDSIKKEAAEQDAHWGLFKDSPWKEEEGGGLEDPSKRTGFSPWGSEEYERQRAEYFKERIGKHAARRLEQIQRSLARRKIGVLEALKRLMEFCDSYRRAFVSSGWGHRLRQIIDELSD